MDHYDALTPEQKKSFARMHYSREIAFREKEITTRNKMHWADAWADKFARKPLPVNPDNPIPSGMTYDAMANHNYYQLHTGDDIAQMQDAIRKRRLSVESTRLLTGKTSKFSIAKQLGSTDLADDYQPKPKYIIK
jgi:hypothetical protein